jgi:predicted GTPase
MINHADEGQLKGISNYLSRISKASKNFREIMEFVQVNRKINYLKYAIVLDSQEGMVIVFIHLSAINSFRFFFVNIKMKNLSNSYKRWIK